MNSFLDTSVLVATFYAQHEHHEASFELFVAQNKDIGCVAAHSLAEVYSVLTGMPGKNRVSPDEALLFLDSIRERFSVIALEPEEYQLALQIAASAGIMGGGIYDALLAYAAQKAKGEHLYTWNVKHFNRFGPGIASRVRTPQ